MSADLVGSAGCAPREWPTPGCAYVARAAMEYGPRKFAAGDPFPLAEVGITDQQAYLLWRATAIDVAPARSPARQPAPAQPQRNQPRR